jgi:hypothetical protein
VQNLDSSSPFDELDAALQRDRSERRIAMLRVAHACETVGASLVAKLPPGGVPKDRCDKPGMDLARQLKLHDRQSFWSWKLCKANTRGAQDRFSTS